MAKVNKKQKQQSEREGIIQNVAYSYLKKEVSEDDANQHILRLIHDAHSVCIFSDKDMKCFNHRRDKLDGSKPRTPLQFILEMMSSHEKEHKTFLRFHEWMSKKCKKEIRWESVGSDIDGKVMIANFWGRLDCPTEPDYKIWKDGEEDKVIFVEVKNLAEEHWFKIYNLKKYAEREAIIVVGSGGLHYVYRKAAIPLLLLKADSDPHKKKWGKECIVVSKNGKDAHFSLKELIKKKMVEFI